MANSLFFSSARILSTTYPSTVNNIKFQTRDPNKREVRRDLPMKVGVEFTIEGKGDTYQ